MPSNRKPIGVEWVYKVKRDLKGNTVKNKARLVEKGYVQKHGVNYNELFTPVAQIETIRILLAMASKSGWKIHHLDMKLVVLNGDLDEEVFVSQPEGFREQSTCDNPLIFRTN